MIFHLPLRHTEGSLGFLVRPLEIDLPIPDHTTLSRRLGKLSEISFRSPGDDQPIHLLIEGTGLRIHVGTLRKPPKRRARRKLHLAVDAVNGEIVTSDPTSRRTGNGTRVTSLLEQMDNPVIALSADGAYDVMGVYEAAQEKGEGRKVRVLIPPGRNARLKPSSSPARRERNRNVLSMRELGRREWHKGSGYSGRAMVENAVYRYKAIIGRSVRSRSMKSQRMEVFLACRILNRMTQLGMPDSYRVA